MDTQKDHLINNIMGNRWNIYYNDYEGGADAISRLNNIKKDYSLTSLASHMIRSLCDKNKIN